MKINIETGQCMHICSILRETAFSYNLAFNKLPLNNYCCFQINIIAMEFIRLLTKIVIFIKLFAIINVQCHFPLNSTTTATEPAKYLNTHNNKIAPPSRSRPAQPNYLDFIDQVNSNDRLIFSEANLEDKFSLSGTGNVLPDEEDDNFMGYRSNNSQFDQNQYEFLRPIHYKIKFRPIFDPIDSGHGRFTVPSSITILFKCYKATNFITLNAKLLNIDETSVTVQKIYSFNFLKDMHLHCIPKRNHILICYVLISGYKDIHK